MEKHEFGGAWTKIKLELLKNYLEAYTRVFSKNKYYKLVYLDAFAGSGRCDTPDELLEGSTSIALRYDRFNEYVFIEKNPLYSASLNLLKEEYPNKRIHVITGDCNFVISKILDRYDWERTRALAFLDPYALELNFSVLESIAATEAIDVWYLFPFNAALRSLKKEVNHDHQPATKIDDLFGVESWREDLYDVDHQVSFEELLGDCDEDQRKTRKHYFELCCYTRSRLESIFASVLHPVVLYNSRNAPLFSLFFAVSNPDTRAVTVANRIATHMTKKSGKYLCGDPQQRTNPYK